MATATATELTPRVPVDEIERAITELSVANSVLDADVTSSGDARRLMALYAKAERLASYGRAALARKIDDVKEISLVTGTSVGRAKDTLRTANVLAECDVLDGALACGEISLDQAAEIATAEVVVPGAAKELIEVAKKETFTALRDKAIKTKLEAQQHQDLFEAQRKARSARSYCDELGMMHLHLRMQPHLGAPLVARAQTQAKRLYRSAKKTPEGPEPFERYLCDAVIEMMSSQSVKGNAKRAELVVLVSHEVAARGWTEVREGEMCKIPGLGPVSPQVARGISQDAFLSGVFFDGTDLRHFKRWSRDIPVAVRTALTLGPPPEFDGIKCSVCGDRLYTEIDHIEPVAANGPTSVGNNEHKCWPCHVDKTDDDRKAGKFGNHPGKDPPRVRPRPRAQGPKPGPPNTS